MTARTLAVTVLVLAWCPAAHAQMPPGADVALQSLDAGQAKYAGIAQQIWEFAEVGYQEVRSSALLQSHLEAAGFTLQKGVAEIPTAFVASWGQGRPVIAIIGEFDALPGLSQAAVPERRPVVEGGAGHGCGHHVFGTGSMAAAIAVKAWLQSGDRPGTVRFYGTPAEEGGSGKVYMVRAGLFQDVDVAVAWHPGDRNQVSASSTLANINGKFRFRGVSSHASAAPEKGRSALDGVEAMNHMVNLLREHVPSDTRIHYVITRGGSAPNVVPDFAEVYYYARQPDMRILEDVWERIGSAARGAALGTGTTVDLEVTGAVHNVLPNEHLAGLMGRQLEQVGGYRYTADEQAFAEAIRKTLPESTLEIGSQERTQAGRTELGGASTDMGDVSWVVPTVQLTAATWVPGTPAHSWQAVAAGGTSIGAKGMMVAARTMTLTALALFADPSQIVKAREEFERRRGTYVWKTALGDRTPALDYRK
jgi:aminobenzoyl-glutamate utilization protein B